MNEAIQFNWYLENLSATSWQFKKFQSADIYLQVPCTSGNILLVNISVQLLYYR